MISFPFVGRLLHQPNKPSLKHKRKSAGVKTIAYPAYLGSRIAFQSRINNADAHASIIYTKVYTKQWTSNIALPCERLEFARFNVSQIKRQFNVFPLCLPSAFLAFDIAKKQKNFETKVEKTENVVLWAINESPCVAKPTQK